MTWRAIEDNQDHRDGPLVSVFTPTFRTGAAIERPFRSLLRQSYPRWEWVVVDDSPESETAAIVADLARSPEAAGRVRSYRQDPPPASIGASKAAAAALCRGEFLVELDHDDELTPEALELIAAAFLTYPEVDFVYADWIDWIEQADGPSYPGHYGAGWGFGLGGYATEMIGGRRVPVALSAPITTETVRHIVAMPNHPRAWRTSFYRDLGGHDHRLPIADDYELLVRTVLAGTMARIPRPLYVQHHRAAGENASRRDNAEIQRLVAEIAAHNHDRLDDRFAELGLPPAPASLTDSAPIAAANLLIDPVAEASSDLDNPLVSVVIPTFRRPDLLHRAIESVLTQSYPHLEVLVVGDACPDVEAVVDQIDDPRVRGAKLTTRADDLGASPRNYALKAMARGSLIAYLDDDNWWEGNHLQSLVDLFRDDPDLAYAFGSFMVEGEPIIFRRPRRYQIDTSALLHRRWLLERFGYWRSPAETDYAHDWELVSRWEGEPWAASLQPTLHYNLATSHQDRQTIDWIRDVADEETRAAGMETAAP